MLLPVDCAVCGAPGRSPCAACTRQLRPAPGLAPPPGVDACWSLLAYDGVGRELVARLKYRNHRGALAGLARAAASLVTRPVDLVTWAPTTPGRRRARGFDHARLLGREVGRSLGCPARRRLLRPEGPAQTGRDRRARWEGPTFAARPVAGSVLVVDDVVTSGATVAAAASALRAAGAATVLVLTLARTPLKTTTVRDEG